MRAQRESPRPSLRVQADMIMVHLRRCGVVVHGAAPMPIPAKAANGQTSVVLFLSKTQEQQEMARKAVLWIAWVHRVTFSGYSPSTMYAYIDTRNGS